MSSEKCIICLRAELNQVNHEDLSCPLFLGYLGTTLEIIDKLNNCDRDAKILTFCRRCRVFRFRLTKLNAKLQTLACKVKESCDAIASKVRAAHHVGQFDLITDEESCDSDHEETHIDGESEDRSIFSTCGQQSPPLEENESRNYSDSKAKKRSDVQLAHAPLDLIPAGATALDAVQSLEESHAVSSKDYDSSKTYTCESCGAVYKKKASLAAHKMTKHGDPNASFPCSDCGKVFQNRIAVFSHRQSAHRKKPTKKITCEPCGKNFIRKDFLEDHVAFVHNGKKAHECQECGDRFRTRLGLRNHLKTHPSTRKYIPSTSGTQSLDENGLPNDAAGGDRADALKNFQENSEVINLAQVEGRSAEVASTGVYENDWLPKTLVLKSTLVVQRLSERDFVYMDKYPFQGTEFGFKCGLCPVIVGFATYKTSPPWFNIVKHLKRRHRGLGEHNSRMTRSTQQRCIQIAPNRFQYGKYLIEEVDGKYKCGECGILTNPAKSLRNRRQHIQRHIMDQHENPSRTYACKDCGIVYNNRTSLSRHKTTKHQNPSGKFPCSDCGAILGSSVAAITHRYTVHPKLYRKKFICEICGKMFNKKAFLEDHVAFVHNGKKINECQICGKKFGSRKGLAIHENSHTEQSTYKCDTCGITFTKNSLFTRHKNLICRPQSMEANGAGPTVNVFEDTWLPENITLPKFSQFVKRKSEREFVYMDKFTFEGTEFGFKCGICPVIVQFSTYKTSSPWVNVVKHFKRSHMDVGDHNSIITGSTIQRCIEVAPNRFQYGKYSIEDVDGKYKCGECGVLKEQAKPHKMQYILRHINYQHENSSKSYVCEYCGAVYKRQVGLTLHKMSKHGDPNARFPCSECGKVFRSRAAAMEHRRSVHHKKPLNNFICDICGKNFGRKDLLENHIAYVHKGLKMHECEECGKKYGTISALKKHQNTHPGNRKYIYNVSGTQPTEENRLTTDSVGGASGDPHDKIEEDSKADGLAEVEETSKDAAQSHDKCQLTSKLHAGPSANTYENHWLPKSLTIKSSPFVKRLSERDFIYKDEFPFKGTEFGFKCGLCPVVVMFCTYKTHAPWENLTKHMKRHHMGDPKVQTIRTVQQRCVEVAPNRFQYGKYSFEKVDGVFKCGECGILKKPAVQFTDSHKNMRKHILERHQKPWRTFSCNNCGVVYNNRSSLRKHKITKHESPNGQFPCSDCGKVCANRVALKSHRRYVHSKLNLKKFPCVICGNNFRTKDAMEDHVAFVHNGHRGYECEECGKKFASRTVLKVHKNNHTGRRKYMCDICGMDFTQQQSIKRHKKTAHGVDK